MSGAPGGAPDTLNPERPRRGFRRPRCPVPVFEEDYYRPPCFALAIFDGWLGRGGFGVSGAPGGAPDTPNPERTWRRFRHPRSPVPAQSSPRF